ncbi:hypothetical protein B0H16DRAFT_1743066 [Mycena metata]|uniref:Uncharacterized protein n=1 Tax=Mycena metata TaxID=1033252 RepID=A0AAD7MEZ5_9AGAR|nr:hypothetical protein B0H16DRAFT_1743066 [Mycena metata]
MLNLEDLYTASLRTSIVSASALPLYSPNTTNTSTNTTEGDADTDEQEERDTVPLGRLPCGARRGRSSTAATSTTTPTQQCGSNNALLPALLRTLARVLLPAAWAEPDVQTRGALWGAVCVFLRVNPSAWLLAPPAPPYGAYAAFRAFLTRGLESVEGTEEEEWEEEDVEEEEGGGGGRACLDPAHALRRVLRRAGWGAVDFNLYLFHLYYYLCSHPSGARAGFVGARELYYLKFHGLLKLYCRYLKLYLKSWDQPNRLAPRPTWLLAPPAPLHGAYAAFRAFLARGCAPLSPNSSGIGIGASGGGGGGEILTLHTLFDAFWGALGGGAPSIFSSTSTPVSTALSAPSASTPTDTNTQNPTDDPAAQLDKKQQTQRPTPAPALTTALPRAPVRRGRIEGNWRGRRRRGGRQSGGTAARAGGWEDLLAAGLTTLGACLRAAGPPTLVCAVLEALVGVEDDATTTGATDATESTESPTPKLPPALVSARIGATGLVLRFDIVAAANNDVRTRGGSAFFDMPFGGGPGSCAIPAGYAAARALREWAAAPQQHSDVGLDAEGADEDADGDSYTEDEVPRDYRRQDNEAFASRGLMAVNNCGLKPPTGTECMQFEIHSGAGGKGGEKWYAKANQG